MNASIHTPLTNLESSLNTLTHAFTATPTAAPAPTAIASLLAADDALAAALQTLWTHQKNHARILELQRQATGLEESVKDVVRRCSEVRAEALQILGEEDSDQEDDGEEEQIEEVNYHTLLNFAQRIGRFNAEAAREAEDLSQRKKEEARRGREGAAETEKGVNGNAAQTNGSSAQNTAEARVLDAGTHSWLNEAAAFNQWNQSLPWPNPERLRLGILGRLQVARERETDGGDAGTWREVKRMEEETLGRKGEDGQGIKEGKEDLESPIERRSFARPAQRPERKKSVTLDLDLYNEDDDEDEDDE